MSNKINDCRTHQKLFRHCALLLYFIGFAAYPSQLSFVDNGHPVKMMETDEMVRTNGLKTLTVNNPTDSIIKSYQVASLIPLLDTVFNSEWKDCDAIKFTALDGYQSIIPISVINKHNGIIAIGENGQRGFSLLVRNNGETVDPGPFFFGVGKYPGRRCQKRTLAQLAVAINDNRINFVRAGISKLLAALR